MTFQWSNITTVPRSRRRLYRNTGWWTKVWNTYSDTRFKKTFRISRSTFKFILNRIGSFVVRETITEEPIMPEMRLAVSLYRLDRGNYLYTIAEMAGLRVSTVCSIVHAVCQVLVTSCGMNAFQAICPKRREILRKRSLTWKSFGSSLAAGQQLMPYIYKMPTGWSRVMHRISQL